MSDDGGAASPRVGGGTLVPTATVGEDAEVLVQMRTARGQLESAALDNLIAVRAWCEAVADAAKQKALAEVALEAAETRAHAEFRLGKALRSGAGVGLNIKSRSDLASLAELTQEQFEETLEDLKRRRTGDQILLFRPATIFRRAQRLFSEEVEDGIRRDFRGFYNGWPTLQGARDELRERELEKLRWQRFTEKMELKATREKPENIRIDEALTRARRLAQSVCHMADNGFGGHPARDHLRVAEGLLGRAAQELHYALQSAVLQEAA